MTTPAVLYDQVPFNDEADTHPKHESKWETDTTIIHESGMETILEDSSTDYVMVPPSAPQEELLVVQATAVQVDEDDYVMVSSSPHERSSVVWNCVQFYLHIGRSWAQVAFARTAVAAHSSARQSSTIYSSYDWVSDAVVDPSGGRLILPGELISLDAPVNEFPDTSLLPRETQRQQYPLGSSTIMVSAHDLLACQPKSTAEKACLASSTSSFSAALWAVAQKKTMAIFHSTQRIVLESSNGIAAKARSYVGKVEQRTHIAATTTGIVHQSLELWFPSDGEELAGATESEVAASEQVVIELPSRGDERVPGGD